MTETPQTPEPASPGIPDWEAQGIPEDDTAEPDDAGVDDDASND